MDSRISIGDKLIIYRGAAIKALRGLFIRPLLKRVHGMFYVGKNVRITHCKHITCGRNVKFEDYSEIHGLCKEGLSFGNNVTISRGTMIRPSSYYGGDLGAGLVMGDNSSFGPHAYVGCSGKIVIGSNVMFGPKCSLFAENHVFDDKTSTIKSQGVRQQGIVIEDNCWIGSNCTILDGVHIGEGCVIGAGTLINKDIPAGSIIVDKRNKCLRDRE